MTLSEKQISNLWKRKLSLYDQKKRVSVGEAFFLLGVFLFISAGTAGFDIRIIKSLGWAYGVFLLIFLAITQIMNILNSQRKKTSKAFFILLHNIQDWGLLTMLIPATWLTGNIDLQKLISNTATIQTSSIYLSLVFITSLLISPLVIHMRAKDHKNNAGKYYPYLFSLAASIPGFALMTIALIKTYTNVDIGNFLIYFGVFIKHPTNS